MMRHVITPLMLLAAATSALAQSTGFTYQGRLDDAGAPADGVYDFRFTLFDAATGGAAVSSVACSDDVPVADGLFSVLVPLLVPPSGADAYLNIQVRAGSGLACVNITGYTTLAPRQPITPAPRAVFAAVVPAQSVAVRGALRYNAATAVFEGFNGAFWIAFATTGAPAEPSNVQDFTAVATTLFFVPTGVFSLGVDLWGAGGGGGAAGPGSVANVCDDQDDPFSGGGGGGGANSYIRASLDVTPGESLIITVGAGGSAGTSTVNGGTGGVTSIIRGGQTVVRAFGGFGGTRGFSHADINETTSFPCPHDVSGFGGVARGDPAVFGPGSIIQVANGSAGSRGASPACYNAFGIPDPPPVFCPAFGGPGGVGPTSAAPLPQLTAGAGGRGATPGGSAAQAGAPGRIRLFWN